MRVERKYTGDPPTMVMAGAVPSDKSITMWREWCLRVNRAESHGFINAIFDCALLGADIARDLDRETDRMLATKLRDLAESFDRKSGGA